MLINQIGVEGEPTVVELRPGRRGRPDPARRVSLTDLLSAVWSVGPAGGSGASDEGGSDVTTLVTPEERDATAREPRRADVA